VAAATFAILVGLVLTIALVVRADDDPQASPTGPGVAQPTPTSDGQGQPRSGAPDQPGTGSGQYQTISKPCIVADWSPLERALGSSVDSQRDESKKRQGFSTLLCSAGIDAEGEAGVAILIMNVFPTGSAEPLFSGLRGAQESKVTPVAGIGQGAFSYDDEILGPHVAAYDGNLFVTVGWSLVTGRANVPTDKLFPALAEVCRQAMSKLKG